MQTLIATTLDLDRKRLTVRPGHSPTATITTATPPKGYILRSCGPAFDEIVADEASENGLFLHAFALEYGVLAVAPEATKVTDPTDDGGITIEFSVPKSTRELVFAVPDDGSVRYFVAREPDGTQHAGVVVKEEGVASLARWLATPSLPLSTAGLQLG